MSDLTLSGLRSKGQRDYFAVTLYCYIMGLEYNLQFFILRGKVKVVNQYFSSPAAGGAKHSQNLNVFLCGCALEEQCQPKEKLKSLN